MNEFEVVARPRTGLGTNASRRLRRTGKIPAILYGGGKDPMPLSLEENRIRKQVENEAFASHVLSVKIEGEESQAVLKSVHRDPATSIWIFSESVRAARSTCASRCTSSTRRTAPARGLAGS